jgi:undecaprenyl pyrophosphate phosphatase UppP
MPPVQEPSPKASDWRTYGLMAIIYAIPTIILGLDAHDKFNFGLAGLGAVSYVFVEGASLIRMAQRSYELPRDVKGYRADYEFVVHAMKALAGFLWFGAAFGDVRVALMVPFMFGASFIM